MPLIEHNASLVVCLGRLRHALNLIDDHSVLVDGRAQKEVHGFLFDQKVSISACLIVSERSADSEDCLPCVGTRQIRVQFVRKLHTLCVLIVLRVKEQVAIRALSQLRESLKVFELSLAVSEHKQVD